MQRAGQPLELTTKEVELLEYLRRNQEQIVSREMVAFEWLHRANTPEFRAVLKEFIR